MKPQTWKAWLVHDTNTGLVTDEFDGAMVCYTKKRWALEFDADPIEVVITEVVKGGRK